jgi:Tfp pilus assembly protein PilO
MTVLLETQDSRKGLRDYLCGWMSQSLECEMSQIKEIGGWGLFERAVTLLLAACVTLLAAQTALTWFYVSASRDINLVTTDQATARALLAVKEQQAASNTRLDAIRDELHSNLSAVRDQLRALNEKASIVAGVTPPETGGSQR